VLFRSPGSAAAAVAAAAAEPGAAAAAAAAPLRKDNSSGYLGVCRVKDSQNLAAGITGGVQGRSEGARLAGIMAGTRFGHVAWLARTVAQWLGQYKRSQGACIPTPSPSHPGAPPHPCLCLQWAASVHTWACMPQLCRLPWCATLASFGSSCKVRWTHGLEGQTLRLHPGHASCGWFVLQLAGPPAAGFHLTHPTLLLLYSGAGMANGEKLNFPDAGLDRDASLLDQVGASCLTLLRMLCCSSALPVAGTLLHIARKWGASGGRAVTAQRLPVAPMLCAHQPYKEPLLCAATHQPQLRAAPDVAGLRAVLAGWAPDNLADVADIVQTSQGGGGMLAASECKPWLTC